MRPTIPHLFNGRLFTAAPSAPGLSLFTLGLPGALFSAGGYSLNPDDTHPIVLFPIKQARYQHMLT